MKPSEFLTNIVDFFAVLLPGAIITFILSKLVSPDSIFSEKIVLTEVQSWVAFILTSYILGGFIFFIGSLLDGKFYDWLCEKPYNWLRINVLNKQFGNEPDKDATFNTAKACKKKMLAKDGESISVIKWAKANIYLFYPGAATELHRFEANSKLYRSVSIVFLLLIIISAIKFLWLFCLISFIAFVFSIICYVDQRYKYKELACIYLIAIYRNALPENIKA